MFTVSKFYLNTQSSQSYVHTRYALYNVNPPLPLNPPVLTRSIYDRHCHSGTEVYLTCILYICQHKHKIVDKQPFYWRSNMNKNPTFTL